MGRIILLQGILQLIANRVLTHEKIGVFLVFYRTDYRTAGAVHYGGSVQAAPAQHENRHQMQGKPARMQERKHIRYELSSIKIYSELTYGI